MCQGRGRACQGPCQGGMGRRGTSSRVRPLRSYPFLHSIAIPKCIVIEFRKGLFTRGERAVAVVVQVLPPLCRCCLYLRTSLQSLALSVSCLFWLLGGGCHVATTARWIQPQHAAPCWTLHGADAADADVHSWCVCVCVCAYTCLCAIVIVYLHVPFGSR